MKLKLSLFLLLLFGGCTVPKAHRYVYVEYGEKVTIFVPSNQRGKWVNFEVEAPKWEDVK